MKQPDYKELEKQIGSVISAPALPAVLVKVVMTWLDNNGFEVVRKK